MYKVLIPFIDAVTGIAYKVGDIVAFDADRAKEILANGNFIEVYVDTGGAGGGSWNDLKDKPFGEEVITYSDTLTWDGNTEGLYSVFGMFYKLSNNVPTKEDLLKGCTISLGNGYTIDIQDYMIVDEEGIIAIGEYAMFVPYDKDVPEVGFVEKGTYFLLTEYGGYTSSITINGYNGFETKTVTTIDSKYLPKALQFGDIEGTIVSGKINSENEGIYYSWVDDVSPLYAGKSYTVKFNNTVYKVVSSLIDDPYGEDEKPLLLGSSLEDLNNAAKNNLDLEYPFTILYYSNYNGLEFNTYLNDAVSFEIIGDVEKSLDSRYTDTLIIKAKYDESTDMYVSSEEDFTLIKRNIGKKAVFLLIGNSLFSYAGTDDVYEYPNHNFKYIDMNSLYLTVSYARLFSNGYMDFAEHTAEIKTSGEDFVDPFAN